MITGVTGPFHISEPKHYGMNAAHNYYGALDRAYNKAVSGYPDSQQMRILDFEAVAQNSIRYTPSGHGIFTNNSRLDRLNVLGFAEETVQRFSRDPSNKTLSRLGGLTYLDLSDFWTSYNADQLSLRAVLDDKELLRPQAQPDFLDTLSQVCSKVFPNWHVADVLGQHLNQKKQDESSVQPTVPRCFYETRKAVFDALANTENKIDIPTMAAYTLLLDGGSTFIMNALVEGAKKPFERLHLVLQSLKLALTTRSQFDGVITAEERKIANELIAAHPREANTIISALKTKFVYGL
jgi:hypothetical protein